MTDTDIEPKPGTKPVKTRPPSKPREYVGGLLIAACCVAVIFMISRIENMEPSTSTPSTTGQRAHP